METGYRFIKVVSSSENLQIPGDFALQMQGDVVILRDRYENLWFVGFTRLRDDKWYFKKDWTPFYKENSLKPLDVVVFEYKGGKLFDFKVFGLDSCEKKGVGHSKLKVKQEDIDDDDDDVQEEKEEHVIVSKSVNLKCSCVCSRNLSGVGVAKVPSKRNYEKKNVAGKKGAGAQPRQVKEEDEEQENISKKIKPTSQSKSSSHAHKITYCSGRGADCYGADIFKSGAVPRPKNPYFVTRSRTPRRKNDLYIPKDVIVDYHLEIPERLFLVDEHDRKWETKIKEWKDGRFWCSRGWGSLCNVNNIDKDDPCICEFVQGQNSNDFHIKVRSINRVQGR